MQGKKNGSIDSLLGYREDTEGKGTRVKRKGESQTERTKDVTWDSQASPQVYYKYSPSMGESGSSVRPPGGVQ